MHLFPITRYLLPITLLLVALLLPQPTAAQDSTPEPVLGRVEGQVENVTADAGPPIGIPVILYALQDFEPTDTFTGTVGSDGGFTFPDIPLVEGLTYIATLEYQNVAYGSAFVTFDGLRETLRLDIEVYEATNDPAVISVGRLHIIVDFGDEQMLVSELYIFDNLSDRVFVGPTGDPEEGTLGLPLPAGAMSSLVERARGDSMVSTANSVFSIEGGYRDTFPVRPGEGAQQLMLIYALPYDDEATVSHPLLYPIGSVSLILSDAGLSVESDLFTGQGQAAMQGMRVWDANDLPAGETLSFHISGEPDMDSAMAEMPGPVKPGSPDPHAEQPETAPLSVAAGDNPTTWAIGAGGLALSLGLLAFFWNRRKTAPRRNPRQKLLQAIVDLDSAHAAGEIPTGRYELEREQLKDELRGWYGRGNR